MGDGRILAERLETLHALGAHAVDAVAAGMPLSVVLNDLLRDVERQGDHETLCSVMLLDDGRLKAAAGPSLPRAFCQGIDGIEIGPAVGSCGTAAYYGEPVFVDDIKSDPLWVDFRDLALAHGLRACWSTPLKDEAGRVLGAFASYSRQVRHPRPYDYEAIGAIAAYVARAVTRARELAQP